MIGIYLVLSAHYYPKREQTARRAAGRGSAVALCPALKADR